MTRLFFWRSENSRFLHYIEQSGPQHQVHTGAVHQQLITLPRMPGVSKQRCDGSLSTSVFRKPTQTDQYLPKLGVVRTLEHRANILISDPDEVQNEKEHFRKALNLCSLSQREHRQGQEQRTGLCCIRD